MYLTSNYIFFFLFFSLLLYSSSSWQAFFVLHIVFNIIAKYSLSSNLRSNRSQVIYKKAISKIFAKFTQRNLYRGLFFNKDAGPPAATLLKIRLRHKCFLVTFAKFLRTGLFENTPGRLLLPPPNFCFHLLV